VREAATQATAVVDASTAGKNGGRGAAAGGGEVVWWWSLRWGVYLDGLGVYLESRRESMVSLRVKL